MKEEWGGWQKEGGKRAKPHLLIQARRLPKLDLASVIPTPGTPGHVSTFPKSRVVQSRNVDFGKVQHRAALLCIQKGFTTTRTVENAILV
ncbi:hypothetical protein M0804_001532 [Polistes exclamans]|nr:hypothetical protein M0804_001532 [Polistes exclamans]